MESEPTFRRSRQRVDGILLLDKPSGVSSNTALQRARRLFDAAKAGHTGTLDPLASGLLPVCFGEATKFAQSMLDARKEYLASVRFGVATSTGDAEGEVIGEGPADVPEAAVRAALTAFIGALQQTPPRHAALKYQGRSYYDYARRGIDIPRPPRLVTIDLLELERYEGSEAVLRVGCSKGTYVRALAEDLAQALGTVGHLAALRRTASGPFRIEHSIALDALDAMASDERASLLLPVDAALDALPRVDLTGAEADAILHGRPVPASTAGKERLRAYGPSGRFIGVVQVEDDLLRASRLVRSDGGEGACA